VPYTLYSFKFSFETNPQTSARVAQKSLQNPNAKIKFLIGKITKFWQI